MLYKPLEGKSQNGICKCYLVRFCLQSFLLKDQVDIFKNKLRTHIFSVLGGLLLHKPLEGKSQNEICNGYLVRFCFQSFLLKNQVDIFKNKPRTHIISVLWGLLLHKPLEGKCQNSIFKVLCVLCFLLCVDISYTS